MHHKGHRENQTNEKICELWRAKTPKQLTHRFNRETHVVAIDRSFCANLLFWVLAAPKRQECNACTEIWESDQSQWRLDTSTIVTCNCKTMYFRDECTHCLRGNRTVDCWPIFLKIVSSMRRDYKRFGSWSRVPPRVTDSDCVTNNNWFPRQTHSPHGVTRKACARLTQQSVA